MRRFFLSSSLALVLLGAVAVASAEARPGWRGGWYAPDTAYYTPDSSTYYAPDTYYSPGYSSYYNPGYTSYYYTPRYYSRPYYYGPSVGVYWGGWGPRGYYRWR